MSVKGLPTSWRGPTRWGNQLNGNQTEYINGLIREEEKWPHSLGQSVEWKQSTGSVLLRIALIPAPLAGAIS